MIEVPEQFFVIFGKIKDCVFLMSARTPFARTTGTLGRFGVLDCLGRNNGGSVHIADGIGDYHISVIHFY
jgi:hypothetical protein